MFAPCSRLLIRHDPSKLKKNTVYKTILLDTALKGYSEKIYCLHLQSKMLRHAGQRIQIYREMWTRIMSAVKLIILHMSWFSDCVVFT